ncbi:fimbrial protein [Pseudomonas fluorescens]|uniref:fimbrial protein n=1 Tax=Pseudomonas fluorescens TaxID=294 RepID=UPI001A9F36A5|nr:fimbrial protein [Pseudomonas fluorescens]QTD31488.1 type 1 fimbrial protein [Pseudomonas fluorescens]
MTRFVHGFQACIAGCSLSLIPEMVMAQCQYAEGIPSVIRTQPLLAGNLTVGRDVPLGAEIYRQSFRPAGSTAVRCVPGLYNIEQRYWLPVTPLPLSRWVAPPFNGKVYESGVQGIGIAIWSGSERNTVPFSMTSPNCNGCNIDATRSQGFDLSLIKIGEVSPGSIQGASLPTVALSFIANGSLEVQRVNFSGSLFIVSRTCLTPDVNVQMGTYSLGAFSGKNTATAWKTFSIALNNCPAFNGYYQGSGPRWNSDGTVSSLETRKSNVLHLRLDATHSAVNPALGILNLDPGESGASATGIGLQVADSHGTPVVLASMRDSGISTRAEEGASYHIPLQARYIQTEDTVTAGPANATATFTLNYY